MILIFDLDYTLLDTASFKSVLCKELNLNSNIFFNFLKINFSDRHINFDINTVMKLLIKQNYIELNKKEVIASNVRNLMKNINKYVFKGCEELLQKYKMQHRLILLTFGNSKWQKEKIDNLKISKYFNEIVIEDTKKSENKILKKIKNLGEKILIINDNAKESLELQKALGKNAKVVLIKSSHSYNTLHNFKILNSFEELKTLNI